jgi:hypothetical protein
VPGVEPDSRAVVRQGNLNEPVLPYLYSYPTLPTDHRRCTERLNPARSTCSGGGAKDQNQISTLGHGRAAQFQCTG